MQLMLMQVDLNPQRKLKTEVAMPTCNGKVKWIIVPKYGQLGQQHFEYFTRKNSQIWTYFSKFQCFLITGRACGHGSRSVKDERNYYVRHCSHFLCEEGFSYSMAGISANDEGIESIQFYNLEVIPYQKLCPIPM